MIRLSRVGKTKQPSYRLIISEKTKDPWGDYLELLGFFDPLANPPKVTLKSERIIYWLSKGAQVSDTAHNLLVDNGVLKTEKRKIKHSKVRVAEEGSTPAPVAKAPEAKPEEKK